MSGGLPTIVQSIGKLHRSALDASDSNIPGDETSIITMAGHSGLTLPFLVASESFGDVWPVRLAAQR